MRCRALVTAAVLAATACAAPATTARTTPAPTPAAARTSSAPAAAPDAAAPGAAAPGAAAPSADVVPAALPAVTVGSRVTVAVSVATLWVSPSSPRPVDAPALRNPVDIRAWLAAMSTSVRLGLVGRVETQALMGEQLLVTGISGGWLRVVALAQPTHRDRRGYPGWVPSRQVTTRAPAVRPTVATVVTSKTWLRRGGLPWIEVSFGTRLPVATRTATTVTVMLPNGLWGAAAASAVSVTAPTAPARTGGTTAVLYTGQRFLRVPYLWGGRSGFAVDCSGLTQLTYAAHGIVLPRDADDQAKRGVYVARSSLRVADLVFFWRSGSIGHVGMYAGGGLLLQAPRTGDVVKLSPLSQMSGYAWARRYM